MWKGGKATCSSLFRRMRSSESSGYACRVQVWGTVGDGAVQGLLGSGQRGLPRADQGRATGDLASNGDDLFGWD
eukprot:3113161-Rhodomonas_salina.1